MKSDTNITFSETETQALAEAIRLANELIESGIDLPESVTRPYSWNLEDIKKFAKKIYKYQVKGATIRIETDE
tara:strand:+ start:664 stop:882 length:219 start_codon:yes stop_codon:yes gene_type:complete